MRRSIVLLLVLLIAGCAGPQQLGGGEWVAVNINGAPVLGTRPITLTLGNSGQVGGNASCNAYSGNYKMGSRQGIRLTGIATTRMLCTPQEVAEQERRYVEILERVESYSRYSDGGLSLIAGDGRAIRFRRN